MKEPEANTLTGIGLLTDLSPDDLAAIERYCWWTRFPAHGQILDRDSDNRHVFFIVSGKVRVVNYSLSGREITLDDLSAGTFFGQLAALDGEPRSASVMALTDTMVASLPPEHFLDLLERYPSVALKVMVHLAHIVRVSTERIMDLSTLGANNRVHAELLREARANMTKTMKP